ncbi:MAG: hypothetical protein NC428_07610 [Clostridium sp.]|nr:hypothetical protein [Clostridium sp.]
MSKYVVGILITGAVVLAGGAAALYGSINSSNTTEKVIYYSRAEQMHYPEIMFEEQTAELTSEDVQETVEAHAAVNAAYMQETGQYTGNDGFMTADNTDISLTDKKEGSASGTTQLVTGNPKPQTAPSGSIQNSRQAAQPAADPKPQAAPSGSAQSNPQPTTPKPAEMTTEKTTEAVWVVDKEAWTEEYPIYNTVQIDVCSGCGAELPGNGGAVDHISADPYDGCGGYHTETKQVYAGTETIYHEEEGHWEYR